MNLRVTFAVLALVTVAGCGGDDDGGDTPTFSGQVEIDGPGVSDDGFLDRVVLSAWGDSATSVYFAGGGLGVVLDGDPVPGLFMHWDGQDFEELGAVDSTLWWVFGLDDDDVWAVGEEGTIVHWDGAELTTTTAPVSSTLSGVWGTSSSDLWAVGGKTSGEAELNDMILHCTGDCTSGDSWVQVEPGEVTGGSYFKIWGSADDDVFLVGENGTIQHWDGDAWTAQDSGVDETLVTVAGTSADDVWAVGGFAEGILLHSDDGGETWEPDDSIAFGLGLTGVDTRASGDVFVVGLNGQRARLEDGTWADHSTEAPHVDLHSIWIDPTGESGFAVGGNFTAPATTVARRLGAIVRIGEPVPAASFNAL